MTKSNLPQAKALREVVHPSGGASLPVYCGAVIVTGWLTLLAVSVSRKSIIAKAPGWAQ
jgi:hypothetical protein